MQNLNAEELKERQLIIEMMGKNAEKWMNDPEKLKIINALASFGVSSNKKSKK